MQRFYTTEKVLELLFEDGEDDIDALRDGYPESMDSAEEETSIYNVYK